VKTKPIDRRKTDRRRVTLDASCRDSGGGEADEVEVTNLSEGGCRIHTPGARLYPNQVVTVRPDSLESVVGVVRWSHNGVAGVEFNGELYPAVVDHLAARNPAVTDQPGLAQPGQLKPRRPAASGFTDVFGRQLPALGERRSRVRD
jgi:hypothetical protein